MSCIKTLFLVSSSSLSHHSSHSAPHACNHTKQGQFLSPLELIKHIKPQTNFPPTLLHAASASELNYFCSHSTQDSDLNCSYLSMTVWVYGAQNGSTNSPGKGCPVQCRKILNSIIQVPWTALCTHLSKHDSSLWTLCQELHCVPTNIMFTLMVILWGKSYSQLFLCRWGIWSQGSELTARNL